jgi:hypothetical protein
MKQSLKSKLNDIIKEARGQVVSINEIERLCHEWHYKPSNAERRLRPSESPNIERVFKNGAIVGYRYQQSETVTAFFRDFPLKVEPEGMLF